MIRFVSFMKYTFWVLLICMMVNTKTFASSKIFTTFGDSNTAHNMYQPKLHKLLPDYTITNRGVSGDTTRDGVHRVVSVLLRDHPDVFFIMFGTNNTGFPFIVYDDITNIVLRAKQFSVPVIMVATVGFTGVSDRDKTIPQINSAIRRVASEQEVILVDIFKSLEETGQNYIREPKHYNDFGHGIIAETIYKTLQLPSRVKKAGIQNSINMFLLNK